MTRRYVYSISFLALFFLMLLIGSPAGFSDEVEIDVQALMNQLTVLKDEISALADEVATIKQAHVDLLEQSRRLIVVANRN